MSKTRNTPTGSDTMNGAETNYDNLYNEGGEGYNPFRAAREDAQRAQAASAPHDEIRAAEREMNACKGAFGDGSPEHEAASDVYFALTAAR